MFDLCIDKRKYVRYNTNIQTNVPNISSDMEVNMSKYSYTTRSIINRNRRLKRLAMIRSRILFTIVITLLVLVLMFLFNSLRTEATEQIPKTTYKYFTYHQIEKGDTLHDLAKEYVSYEFYDNLQEYIEEVKEINHLTDDVIITGQLLVIPYFSTEHK